MRGFRLARVLEDHLHLATHLPELAAAERGEAPVQEGHVAGGWLVQLQDGAAGSALAAARLADQAERLAALDVERDIVDGSYPAHLPLQDDALGNREVHLQVLNPQ